MVARFLAVMLFVGVLLPPVPASARTAADPETTPLDMVIAVDESGSLSPQDVAREIEAATTIALSALNPRSRVTVLGFGSNNGGQQAVTEVCRPTLSDSQVKLDYLAGCTRELHRRNDGEGNDTDHVAALSQALNTLSNGSPKGALKVIFLLTDGNLDVSRSPNYGRSAELRNQEAARQLSTHLGLASADGVQVWPLGFGDVDQAALDRFAAGGSQQSCDGRSASRPRARVVNDSQDVLRSLTDAYAAATCSGVSRSDTGTLRPGKSVTLTLAIPQIATDGKITVSKGDPRVRVDYIGPDGKTVPTRGRLGATEFSRSGENSTVETLGLVNPASGTWKVRLSAPSQLAKQVVSATAIWQGAVQSSIVVEPPTGRIGQALTVRLSLVTRTGAITDRRALAGLNFAVIAEGPGLPAGHDIVIRDDGRAPDDQAGDGRYAGTLTAPRTPGAVTFTGVVSGPGIRAERLPVTAQITAEGPVVQGRVAIDQRRVVHPGQSVKGTVLMENAAAPVRARLTLDGPRQAGASLDVTDIDVPKGRSEKEFAVSFPSDAALGGTSYTIRLVDAADPAKVYASGLLTTTVEPPPGWWERHRAKVYALLALLLAVAGLTFTRRLRRRRAQDVRGLVAALHRDGQPFGLLLRAPKARWSADFRFVIHDDDGPQPKLAYPQRGESDVLIARRGPRGKVVVTAHGARYEIEIGGPGREIVTSGGHDSGWTLAFTDLRRGRSGRSGGSGASGGRRPGAPTGPAPDSSPSSSSVPPPSSPTSSVSGHTANPDWL